MKVSKIVLRNKVEPGVENSIKIKDLSTNESRLHGNIHHLKMFHHLLHTRLCRTLQHRQVLFTIIKLHGVII
jgi:hypothetical protein